MGNIPPNPSFRARTAWIALAFSLSLVAISNVSRCEAGSSIPSGAYALSSANAPSCLAQSADPGAAAGGALVLGLKTKATSNKWIFTDKGGGKYLIQPADSPSLAVTDIKGGDLDGCAVDLEPVRKDTTQLWTLKKVSDGVYLICPVCAPSLSLDVFAGGAAPGSKIDVWTADPEDSDTLWSILPYSDSVFKPSIADGKYTITPHDGPSLVLGPRGGASTAGSAIVGSVPDGSASQTWVIADATDGMVTLTLQSASTMALTVKDGGSKTTTPLLLQPLKQGDPSQMWRMIELGGGTGEFMLIPACATKEAIDNPGGAPNAGTAIWIWDVDSNNSHEWWMFKAVKG